MKPSIIINKLQKLLIAVIWLIVWYILYKIVGKDILVPSPLATFVKLGEMVQNIVFYQQIGATFYRVLMGGGISLVLGIATALLSHFSLWIREVIKPLMSFMKSTPVMAITILALLWFESHTVPIFVCFLMCYPIVYTNILMGFLKLDNKLIELNKVYQVKPLYAIKLCYLPQLMPYLKAALQLVVGMAWKVVVAAEVLAIPKYAMGYELLEAKIYLETSELFAWVMVIVLLSGCCEHFVGYMLHRKETYDDRNHQSL